MYYIWETKSQQPNSPLKGNQLPFLYMSLSLWIIVVNKDASFNLDCILFGQAIYVLSTLCGVE